VARVLPELAAGRRHRPEVHVSVAIAQKVEASSPGHRVLAGAFVVGRQRDGFVVARREPPEVLRRASLVALRVAALEREPCEVQRSSVLGVSAISCLGERDELSRAGAWIDPDELGVRKCRMAACRVEDLAGRRPPDHVSRGTVIGVSGRHAAVERKRVDLGRTLVCGRERKRLPVRRERRPGLFGRMSRESLRGTTLNADTPEVPFGGEDERVTVNRGEPVVAECSWRGWDLCAGFCGVGSVSMPARGRFGMNEGTDGEYRCERHRDAAVENEA
jgi:hypothetical protein